MARSRRSSTGRPGRPQAPPPILRCRASEPFEGADLLEEVRRETGALALWQALRDVLLWAFAPECERRDGLFAPDAGRTAAKLEADAEPELEVAVPLRELSAVWTSPGAACPEHVAGACRRISLWAEERVYPRSALAFAYAAAVAAPRSADHAYRVGVLARREADHGRAEAWLRRAVALARRCGDVRSQGLALVGMGNLFLQRGDYSRAEDAHRRALRLSRRHGVRSVRAMALHDLCVISYECGRLDHAEGYAHRAYRAYGPRHPNLPALAHDVAIFWLMQGKFGRALDAFKTVRRLVKTSSAQLRVSGNVAHAAGGAGRHDDFTAAWAQAWRIIDSQPASESTAPALLNLAFGAAHLEDWERLEVAASLALRTATARGEGRIQEEAEVLLRSARSRSMPPGRVGVYPPRDSEYGEALAARLMEALGSACG